MTTRSTFSDEEWAAVIEGPAIAGLVVMFAERGGTVLETVAMTQAYAAARAHEQTTELLREVVAHPPQLGQGAFGSSDALAADGIDRLRSAVSLVERSATAEELDDYKRFARWIAEQVALAHKEGGVLGIGGTPVSANERDALDAISEVLGFPPRDPAAAGA